MKTRTRPELVRTDTASVRYFDYKLEFGSALMSRLRSAAFWLHSGCFGIAYQQFYHQVLVPEDHLSVRFILTLEGGRLTADELCKFQVPQMADDGSVPLSLEALELQASTATRPTGPVQTPAPCNRVHLCLPPRGELIDGAHGAHGVHGGNFGRPTTAQACMRV